MRLVVKEKSKVEWMKDMEICSEGLPDVCAV